MAQPTTHTPKKLNRKRELNVIYFIDSDKTRSFKLSLNKVKLISGAVALTAIWALASFWVLVKMTGYQAHADKRITEIQSIIFDFQTRYGQVYETAYPKGEQLVAEEPPKEVEAAGIKPAEVTPQVPPVEVARVESKPAERQPEPGKQLAAKPVLPVATPAPEQDLSEDPAVEKPTVKVEGAKFSPSGDILNLNFAIRNTLSPKKALGYMWGIATYKTDAGDTIHVGYPKGINANGDGNATNTNNATRYNIRRFKLVKVNFPSPQGVPGKFQDVKIVVMDREGNRQGYNLPVTVNVGFVAGSKNAPQTQPSTEVGEPLQDDAIGVTDDVDPEAEQPEVETNEVNAVEDDLP